MVQNHMLQLLCLVAMEPPVLDGGGRGARREAEGAALAASRINGNEAPKHDGARPVSRRRLGQRRRSRAISRSSASGDSNTETFVAIKAEIANWRWAGVPFYLRTGKRLAARVSEIVIEFKPIPHSIFDDSAGSISANQLVIRLQPDEGVKQWMMIKDPGPGGMRLRHVPLDMSFAESLPGAQSGRL